MYFKTNEKKECMGCGACFAICHKDAIEMSYDKRGFWYPAIDSSLCVHCGKCEWICPLGMIPNNEQKMEIFCGSHREKAVMLNSSSGGAFSALCQVFLENENTYSIYGAFYNKDIKNVCHGSIDDISKIGRFRKSKYVQSDMSSVYSLIKSDLIKGKKVIFSGVACQIAALRKYLVKEWENLLLIEVMCHGVGSPQVFQRFVKYIERLYKSEVENVDMRDKQSDLHLKWQLSKTKIYFQSKKSISNLLAQGYLEFYRTRGAFRDSCYKCDYQFKYKDNRIWGDVLIADFHKKLEKKNASLIIIRNKINPTLLNEYLEIKKINYYGAVKGNAGLLYRDQKKMWEYCVDEINIKTLMKCVLRNEWKKFKVKG